MTAPLYEIRKRKTEGAPYVVHSLFVGGALVYQQLGPFTEEEIEQRINAHLHPTPVRAFDPHPKIRPGPRKGVKRTATVTVRGFLWREEEQ